MNNYSCTSLIGLRDKNEDSHIIMINNNNNDKEIKHLNFYAIFDGHGDAKGKNASKFVADNLPLFFTDKRVSYPLKPKYVTMVYEHVEKNLEKLPFSKECGSTSLTVSHYTKNNIGYLNITNLGDCRVVLCRGELAIALSQDHRPMWPKERQRILKLGGKIEFDNYDWRIQNYSVSRSFGDTNAHPYISYLPDLYKYKLIDNDKFFVLGCDGLWDYISEQDAINFILATAYCNNKLNKNVIKNIAKELAHVALKKGSTDNVSIIIVFL